MAGTRHKRLKAHDARVSVPWPEYQWIVSHWRTLLWAGGGALVGAGATTGYFLAWLATHQCW